MAEATTAKDDPKNWSDNALGVVPVFLAVEEVTKVVYAEVVAGTPENAAAFLGHLVAEFAQRILRSR